MEYLHADSGSDGQLRLVFDDCVVSRRLGADATLGDVAKELRDLGAGRHGNPVAIDVTLPIDPFGSSFSMPPGMMFEDDPAALFADMSPWAGLPRLPVVPAVSRR